MAITQAMADSFKVQILSGQQNLVSGSSQTYKLALYTVAATLSNSTTAYTTLNEVTSSGSNYTAGGNTLTISTSPTSTGNVAFMSFNNTSWTNANISAGGALIYNSTANTAVAVLNFGSNVTSTNGTFTVIFPAAAAGSAIIQIG
jgi:hypothetical protein